MWNTLFSRPHFDMWIQLKCMLWKVYSRKAWFLLYSPINIKTNKFCFLKKFLVAHPIPDTPARTRTKQEVLRGQPTAPLPDSRATWKQNTVGERPPLSFLDRTCLFQPWALESLLVFYNPTPAYHPSLRLHSSQFPEVLPQPTLSCLCHCPCRSPYPRFHRPSSPANNQYIL